MIEAAPTKANRMPPGRFVRTMLAILVGLLILHDPHLGGAAEQAAVEPRAAELLNAALTHLARTASLRIRAEVITETVLPSGQRLHYPGTLEISLRRPDRLWYRLDGEQRRVAAWYDGKSFTLLDGEKNVSASTQAPRGLGQLFDDMSARLKFRPPLSVLLREDSPGLVARHMIGGFSIGQGDIAGTACHHLAFQQESVDLEFWIAAGGDPVIKRIVITHKKQADLPQTTYTITAWEPDAVLDDALFIFVPPPHVVRCDFQSLAD